MSYPSIPCTECNFPTRKQRVTIDQAPGTLVRKGTLCWRCYKLANPQPDYKRLSRERSVASGFNPGLATVALEGYMTERRARLARR